MINCGPGTQSSIGSPVRSHACRHPVLGAEGRAQIRTAPMPTSKPEIGLPNASQYLHDALLSAYRRFQFAQTRATALEVAQAAWALHERLWHDQDCKPDLKQFRAELFQGCPELQLMRDHAEAGKHVELGREGVQLIEKI
jgi:hypothetical protein